MNLEKKWWVFIFLGIVIGLEKIFSGARKRCS